MNQSVDSLNQQEKVSNARVAGDIFSTIVECFILAEGITTRQDILAYVADVIGLTASEVKAEHIVESGIKKNYLNSHVDYVLNEMKNGNHGEEYIIISEEKNGIWIMDDACGIDMDSVKVLSHRRSINDETLKKELRGEISEEYNSLTEEEKKLFKKSGGTMDKVIQLILKDLTLSARDSIEYFTSK